jgi:hypothetical protein
MLNLYKFEELMMKKLSLLAMTSVVSSVLTSVLFTLTATSALAKLPAPSDEAKAKAAEAAAKTAWSGKVDAFLLCKYQDTTAGHYYKTAKSTKPAAATPACVDPGAFVYPLPDATAAAAPAAPAAATAAAPAANAAATKPAAPATPAVLAAPAKKS